jgi:outer membrane biosynthesis protein TonB
MKTKSKSSKKVTKKPAAKKTVKPTIKKKKVAAKPVKKVAAAKKSRKASPKKTAKKAVAKKKAVTTTRKKKTPLKPAKRSAELAPPVKPQIPAAIIAKPSVTVNAPLPGTELTSASPSSHLIGQVILYVDPSNEAKIELDDGVLHLGDTIHIKGDITDFEQVVESMEIDHQNVSTAVAGQTVGVEVRYAAQEHDKVYKKEG